MSSNLKCKGRSCAGESAGVVRLLLLAAVVVVATTSVCLGLVITKINTRRDVNNKITASIELGGCTTNADCDDLLFCNGEETCDGGTCIPGDDPDCQFGCDEQNDTCVIGFSGDDHDTGVPAPPVGTVSTNTACDTIAVAVVVDNGQTINILSVAPGNVKASPVDGAHQTLLASALSALGLFDDSTQDLFFTLYNPPNPCTNIKVTVEFTIKGTAPGSDPKAVDRLMAGSTNLKDLENAVNNNKPLNNFESVNAPIIGPDSIPAASTWGLVVLGLALLVGAKIRYGRQSRRA